MSLKKMNLAYLIGLILIMGTVTKADFPFGWDKDFKEGPKKEWSQSKFERYYRWTERIRTRSLEGDEQILRRQYAIITGNKITSEIWNYGSISRPGNRITDIIWEGLGYGYEFGPFICAEVPVAPQSHQDAYPKEENGDTTW